MVALRCNKRLLAPLLVAILFVSAMGLTNAHFMADTGGYVVSILAFAGISEYVVENPVVRDYRSENSFWDFGHLLWRPLGLLLFKLLRPISSVVVGSDPAYNVLFLLMSVNFVAGLLSAVLLYALIRTITGQPWLAVFVAVCFILSHGFLNFTQTGSAYIAGLGFLIAGLYLLLKDKGDLSPRSAILGGLACAAAIILWFPYVLVIPAVIVAPVVLFGWGEVRKQSVVYAGVTFLAAAAIAYLAVMREVGINGPSDLRDWVTASSHGVRTHGFARMVFGFARSFIHLGNDGVLFKRFLLHDPFNPVTVFDLVRLSLWKLTLFYLALGSVVISLFAFTGRRVLALLILTAAPLLLFAIWFDGGAVERYLPLYPLIFIAFAWILASSQVPRVLKIAPIMFFGFAVLVNLGAMARMVLDKQNQRTLERLQPIVRQLGSNSWLVTTHLQDDLVNFQASFPFEPVNRHNNYHIYPLVVVNSDQALRWREEFAAHTLETWAKGGDVWLSTRLFSAKPEAGWNWIEGDDPRVPWNDLHSFFAQLQTCGVTSGADGFVQLGQSEANIRFLSTILHKAQGRELTTQSILTKDCK